jgi:single-strand DNA-binding protein
MDDTNSCVFVGRLVKDAELKYLSSGTPILTFGLAVNRSAKDGDKWVSVASFLDFKYFGKGAEAVAKYMTKGQQVSVVAEAEQDRWTDKDGASRSKVIFKANHVQLVGSKPGANAVGTGHDTLQEGAPVHEEPFHDDTIPF